MAAVAALMRWLRSFMPALKLSQWYAVWGGTMLVMVGDWVGRWLDWWTAGVQGDLYSFVFLLLCFTRLDWSGGFRYHFVRPLGSTGGYELVSWWIARKLVKGGGWEVNRVYMRGTDVLREERIDGAENQPKN